MRPRKSVDQWRAIVWTAPVSDAVRVYLLKLAEHMKADRTVSVPRSRIAKELGRHEQRIAERTKAAVDAGLLAVVSKGYRGSTAVYQGTFPDAGGATKRTDLQYAKDLLERYAFSPELPAMPGECVPDGEYASSKRAATGAAVGNLPDEEQRRGEAGRESAPIVRAEVDRLGDTESIRRRSA